MDDAEIDVDGVKFHFVITCGRPPCTGTALSCPAPDPTLAVPTSRAAVAFNAEALLALAGGDKEFADDIDTMISSMDYSRLWCAAAAAAPTRTIGSLAALRAGRSSQYGDKKTMPISIALGLEGNEQVRTSMHRCLRPPPPEAGALVASEPRCAPRVRAASRADIWQRDLLEYF